MAIYEIGGGMIRVEHDAGFVRVTVVNEHTNTVSLAILTIVEAGDLCDLIKRTASQADKYLDEMDA